VLRDRDAIAKRSFTAVLVGVVTVVLVVSLTGFLVMFAWFRVGVLLRCASS
jgi:hypothetical protein